MRKLIFGTLVIMLVLFGNVFAYAGSLDETCTAVEITGDFNFDCRRVSTFNDEKTLSGTAPKGAVVEIRVSTKNFSGKFKEKELYTIEIGSSELFSQAIDLAIGENLVEFSATVNGVADCENSVIVNRKRMAIKTQLENSIYIPGGICY